MSPFAALVAMAPAAPGQAPSGPLGVIAGFAPFLLIFAVFYFLLIAPARKKQKAHLQMLSGLKAGDKVVTTGGIHGTIVGVTDDVFQIRIADQVKIDVSRHAVAEKRA